MIFKIKQFFERHFIDASAVASEDIESRLQLASAALMIEVLHADHSLEQSELDSLRSVLQDSFAIDEAHANELILLAEAERTEATDYYQFTSLINEFYTQQEKRDLVTRLWQMAYADNRIHKFEEHLVRRLADLMHVPHSAFIQSKHKASAD